MKLYRLYRDHQWEPENYGLFRSLEACLKKILEQKQDRELPKITYMQDGHIRLEGEWCIDEEQVQ